MKIKLLKKSPPFIKKYGKDVCRTASDTCSEGLFITFLGLVLETSAIKQFYCLVNTQDSIVPCHFSTLIFAEIGDELDVLPWRDRNENGNCGNLGSCVINVQNLSHPEFNVSVDMLSYEDEWG